MKHGYIVGVDLGLNGAVCMYREEYPGPLEMFPMPVEGKHINWDKLIETLSKNTGPAHWDECFVVFEKLGQIYQSSKATAMSMGRQSEGMIVLCKCLRIPYAEIPPKEWQGKMFMGIDKIKKSTGAVDTKAMALVKVRQLYPKLKLTFGERATKPHDGLIDSVLLCDYARRYL